MIGNSGILALAAVLRRRADIAGRADRQSGLRGTTPLNDEGPAPRDDADAQHRGERAAQLSRAAAGIPHSIDGYQIDINGNKCLSCHARARTGESQAPMVSITHFMDRDGQFLASVSPRRFFCTACHVPQHEVKPPVEQRFRRYRHPAEPRAPGGRR